MQDRWRPHRADDYAEAIAGDLPTGEFWPRDPDHPLMLWVAGCARIWGDVDARAAALLITESDPRRTIEMLTDWERAFGLPDPCVAEPLTIEDRRKALITRITTQGGQSRAFFKAIAQGLGYVIEIFEYAPFQAGISRCGDTRPSTDPVYAKDYFWRIGDPDMRFAWRVKLFNTRLLWFRAGSGQAGVDPMLRIALATDLECVIRRWKPAHTTVVFDYSEVDYSGSLGGFDFTDPRNSGLVALL